MREGMQPTKWTLREAMEAAQAYTRARWIVAIGLMVGVGLVCVEFSWAASGQLTGQERELTVVKAVATITPSPLWSEPNYSTTYEGGYRWSQTAPTRHPVLGAVIVAKKKGPFEKVAGEVDPDREDAPRKAKEWIEDKADENCEWWLGRQGRVDWSDGRTRWRNQKCRHGNFTNGRADYHDVWHCWIELTYWCRDDAG
jgi:hypothetical protein